MNIRLLLGLMVAMAGTASAVDISGHIEFLRSHPFETPKKVTLKAPVSFPLVMNGKVVGSISKPAEAEVDVVRFVEPDKLEITAGQSKTTITPDQSNFWDRVENARVKSLANTAEPIDARVDASVPATPLAPSPEPVASTVPETPAEPQTAPAPAAPLPPVSPVSFDVSMPTRGGLIKADFRLKLVDERPVKGVLVLVPGINGDGRPEVDIGRWNTMARDLNLAIMGCFLQGNYWDADQGSGKALLGALKEFAEMSKHPELAEAPLLLWGHSAGGMFNYGFVCYKPERVAAFIVNKGGEYIGTANAECRKVPGIFFLGMKDTPKRINAVTDTYEKGRRQGALWALGPAPREGHWAGGTIVVADAFFRAIVPTRLSADGKILPMDETKGWLADPKNVTVEPSATSQIKKKTDAGWLPDESTAQAWMIFMK